MIGVVGLLLAIGLGGCMSAEPTAPLIPLSPELAQELAGTWQGWLVTEQSFAHYQLDIKDDGSFTVTGPWVHARGVLGVVDGTLRFDGNGLWRGTLVLEPGGNRRTLKLDRDDHLVRGSLHRAAPDG